MIDVYRPDLKQFCILVFTLNEANSRKSNRRSENSLNNLKNTWNNKETLSIYCDMLKYRLYIHINCRPGKNMSVFFRAISMLF